MTTSLQWLMANRARWLRWGGLFGSYALAQLAVQALNALAGFLLIRSMGKVDYAWFTIASGMNAALVVLAESGIASAVTAIGGETWQDPGRMSALVRMALRWRNRMALLATILVSPFSMWLLLHNGSSVAHAAALTAIVLVPLWHTSTSSILAVLNRLNSRVRQLQVADLAPALVRVVLTAALVVSGLATPAMALLAMLLSQWGQMWLIKRQVAPLLAAPADPTVEAAFDARIRRTIRHMYPNALFICLQSQLATWLISVFASTGEVADYGALNRLAVVFAVFGGPVVHWIGPAFAKSTSPQRLLRIFAGVMVLLSVLCFSVLAFAAIKGEWILWVLGPKYTHLNRELLVILGAMSLHTVAQTIWALNMARGWVSTAWFNIPLVLATQAVALSFMRVDTVRGVALFSAIVSAAQLCHAVWVVARGLLAVRHEAVSS